MSSRQLLFKVFYRLGFMPWDGHPLAKSLQDLVEGKGALGPGTALDLGCGTGDNLSTWPSTAGASPAWTS